MKLDNLFTDDDRAVSPVIGVVLMVAITVILAAVIGSFVLDLSSQTNETAPQVTLDAEVNADNNVTITHNGGDSLKSSETRVTITLANGSTVDFNADGSSELSVGGSTEFDTSSPASVSGGLSGLSPSGSVAIGDGDTVTVKVIDTDSQQIVASFELDA